jgi:hypothetical protein
MKPRERVELALSHKEPDHIPIDLGATICSSIHKQAYIDLKRHLRSRPRLSMASIERDVSRAFGRR